MKIAGMSTDAWARMMGGKEGGINRESHRAESHAVAILVNDAGNARR
jgi:hypothetical protein